GINRDNKHKPASPRPLTWPRADVIHIPPTLRHTLRPLQRRRPITRPFTARLPPSPPLPPRSAPRSNAFQASPTPGVQRGVFRIFGGEACAARAVITPLGRTPRGAVLFPTASVVVLPTPALLRPTAARDGAPRAPPAPLPPPPAPLRPLPAAAIQQRLHPLAI
ncbi:hypothetical protein T484DRAFT_1878163, partial [Baffinella frigidus]